MSEARTWSVELDVRDDAPSVFIPLNVLPDAVPGDLVTITAPDAATVRHGRVAELLDDHERGRFFTVTLD